jgi:hypothetical protein
VEAEQVLWEQLLWLQKEEKNSRLSIDLAAIQDDVTIVQRGVSFLSPGRVYWQRDACTRGEVVLLTETEKARRRATVTATATDQCSGGFRRCAGTCSILSASSIFLALLCM